MISNNYQYKYFGTCPLDNETIEFSLSIETDKTIIVEHIVVGVKTICNELHEHQADKLLEMFGGKQYLTAVHQGVRITTTREKA